jgi:hypothetical protein
MFSVGGQCLHRAPVRLREGIGLAVQLAVAALIAGETANHQDQAIADHGDGR